jgi:hypothetical protein
MTAEQTKDILTTKILARLEPQAKERRDLNHKERKGYEEKHFGLGASDVLAQE